jgi:caffeoyl-CoA O-methyltransferase
METKLANSRALFLFLKRIDAMHFLDPALEAYLASHHSLENELLAQLDRETHIKTLNPRMLSGPLQGRFLSFLSKLSRPQYILDIGTFTGYSALCLAEGLAENGELHTLEINDELETFAAKYFRQSNYSTRIVQHIGDALETLRELQKPWDLVFIDADKPRYLDYYQKLLPQMPSGALLIADNVLWSGKVLQTPNAKDESTIALLQFNKFVQEDDRVENVLLPLRDGLMCIRKK